MQQKLSGLSKQECRAVCRDIRRNIDDKRRRDEQICDTFVSSTMYRDSQQILAYLALDDEVNCDYIISKALAEGKRVAVPYCIDHNGNMEYYYIRSFDDLLIGSYGIREPITDCCETVTDFYSAAVLVPGMAFDIHGYRLGYGKGYYDRFLKKFTFNSTGLCYNTLVVDNIVSDEYDIPVNHIITECRIIECEAGG